jgi:hypothetical protein
MSIASKPIAGCSPIAAGSCITAPLVTVFWGPTSVVFEPSFVQDFVTVFWGPTSQVFPMVLVDPNAGEGDCISATPHENIAYAYALDDEVSVDPWQQCKKAA